MLNDGWIIITLPNGLTIRVPKFKALVWPRIPKKGWVIAAPVGEPVVDPGTKPQPQPWVRRPELGSAVADHALDDLVALSSLHELAKRLHDPALTDRVQGLLAAIVEDVASNIPREAATVSIRS